MGDGRGAGRAATSLNEGYLKASHRLSHEWTTPVVPGVVTGLPIEIFPMHWRFGAGHRLRLRIYGGHSMELTPEPLPVTTSLSLGAGGSTVTLPIVGGRPDLTVAAPTVATRRVNGADELTFSATVSNVGEGDAADPTVRFLLDGGPGDRQARCGRQRDGDLRRVEREARNREPHHPRHRRPRRQRRRERRGEQHRGHLFVVRGNKLRNGSFEESANGTAPDAGTSSGATSYSSDGSDGSRSAGTMPGGMWTSEPVPVTPGATYRVSVSTSGAGGTLLIQQIAADGTVTSSLPLAPSLPFARSQLPLVALPSTVQLRVVLLGGITGTTTFDEVEVVET